MADEVGIALLGAGFAGRVHALAARMLGARLVGVAASTPARSDAAAAEFGAEYAFADAAELVAHPEVEVVHVCTPNALHVPHVQLALDHGKHVICEKPLATSAADTARLSSVAREAGLIAAVCFAYRYQSVAQQARAKIMSGELGSIRLVHGAYLQDWLLYQDDTDWRADSGMGGRSRAFADIGSHWCDLAEWMTGQRITDLAAVTSTVYPTRRAPAGAAGPGPADMQVDNEDVACVIFRATGGTVGTLTVSQVSPGRKNRLWLEIDAADASVVFDQENSEWLWLGRRSAGEIIARDGRGTTAPRGDTSFLPPGHPRGFVECFASLFADVYCAIRNEPGRDFPTFDDGARSAVLTEAVLRSASERKWVRIA